MKKETIMLSVITISIFLVVILGASFAYFTASIGGTGNNTNNTTKVTMTSLGTIKYTGETIFNERDIYPGYKNIQTFAIEKDTQEGIGTYEIDLEGVVPSEFGSDIEITLYKTTDPANNKIEREEGSFIQNGNQFSKEDRLTIKGTPEVIYGPTTLTNTKELILEQQDFDTNTLEKTTYYLVYQYKNNNNQNNQQGQVFNSKVTVKLINKKKYKETLLNGTDPVISGSLIPVIIENDGTVKKVNIASEWYKYENQQWANAIILSDETKTYQNEEVIPESNIESYFVWIPRYKYKIFNEGNYPVRTTIENKVQSIEVVFENKDTPVSTGSTVGSWLTHPAFTSFNTNGMWVGKFETSKISGSNNVRNKEQVQIKPNISNWGDIQVGNAFYTSYDYQRGLESHMMKNTEWGGVSYLQHSIYGSNQSVRINNNSSFITGNAGNSGTGSCNDGTCNKPYNTTTGYLASTTANITGIYDMAGGAWEFVMGVMLDESGKPMSGRNSLFNSGFNGPLGCPTCDSDTSGITSITNGLPWPDPKYYDTYAYSTSSDQFQRRILGDATGEVGPFGSNQGSWYTDDAYFVNSPTPWFVRGGDYSYGTNAGAMAFTGNSGNAQIRSGFRLVLIP